MPPFHPLCCRKNYNVAILSNMWNKIVLKLSKRIKSYNLSNDLKHINDVRPLKDTKN